MSNLVPFGQSELSPVASSQMLCLIASLYWDREDAIRELIGPNASILKYVHQPDSWPPSYVLIRSETAYVLCMAGTSNLLVQPPWHVAGSFWRGSGVPGCQSNGQWEQAWGTVWAECRPLLPDDLDGVDLRLSGHSYGGALAELGALLLAQETGSPTLSVLTVGGAKPLTTGYTGVVPTMWHLHSYGDPVFGLPPGTDLAAWVPSWSLPLYTVAQRFTWVHYGTAIPLGPQGKFGPGEEPDDPLEPLVTLAPVGQHASANYWGRLNAWYQRSSKPYLMGEALRITLAVIRGRSVQTIAEGLPRVAVGPGNVPFVVPDYAGIISPPLRVRTMAYPTPLTGGFPFRVNRYTNVFQNGFLNSYVIYFFGDNYEAAYKQVQAHTAQVTAAYRRASTEDAQLVGARIGLDNQINSAEPFFIGDNIGLGNGKKLVGTSQAKVTWDLRIKTLAGGSKGTWEVSGLPSSDTNITTRGINPLTFSVSTNVSTLIADLKALFVAGQNSATIAGFNGIGCMKIRDTNPATNAPLVISAFGTTNAGYLTVATQTAIPGAELGKNLAIKLNRGNCTKGISGSYRIIDIANIGPPFIYTLNKMPCCPLTSLQRWTGTVTLVKYIYAAIGDIYGLRVSTRDRGPAFFAGRGRQGGRCC